MTIKNHVGVQKKPGNHNNNMKMMFVEKFGQKVVGLQSLLMIVVDRRTRGLANLDKNFFHSASSFLRLPTTNNNNNWRNIMSQRVN